MPNKELFGGDGDGLDFDEEYWARESLDLDESARRRMTTEIFPADIGGVSESIDVGREDVDFHDVREVRAFRR